MVLISWNLRQNPWTRQSRGETSGHTWRAGRRTLVDTGARAEAAVTTCRVHRFHTTRTRANDCTHLERWGHAFGDEETTLGRALSVVLGHQIIREPDAIRFFRSTLSFERRASVSGQRREDDAVLELNLAICDGHRLEQLRLGLRGARHGNGVTVGQTLVLEKKRLAMRGTRLSEMQVGEILVLNALCRMDANQDPTLPRPIIGGVRKKPGASCAIVRAN